MRIVEYTVLCSRDIRAAVRKALIEGWQPIGGIAIESNGETSQAMVKYDTYTIETKDAGRSAGAYTGPR